MVKEKWYIKLLKLLGIIQTYEASKKDICMSIKDTCNRECDKCAIRYW